MNDRELLDYILSIFPAHAGCVAMSSFHSLMVNTVLPAYSKLRDEQTQLLQEQDDGQSTD